MPQSVGATAPSIDRALAAQNRVLALLDDESFERIRPSLELLEMKLWDPICDPGEPITSVYFPLDAIASTVSVMHDKTEIEIGTTGREGMTGLAIMMADEPTPHRTFCQVPGRMLRLDADVLRDELQRSASTRTVLGRCLQSLFIQTAQTAACNRAHPIVERCARWLLMTQDRVRKDNFLLTQEILAQMLGVRRAGVNVAARTLQRAGLIDYRRGKITVLDREGLVASSCECYEIVRRETERLVPEHA